MILQVEGNLCPVLSALLEPKNSGRITTSISAEVVLDTGARVYPIRKEQWDLGCTTRGGDCLIFFMEPETSVYKWSFQLDDEPNLYIGNGWNSPFPSI